MALQMAESAPENQRMYGVTKAASQRIGRNFDSALPCRHTSFVPEGDHGAGC